MEQELAEREIEKKNIVDWITKKLVKPFSLEPFRAKVGDFLSKEYLSSMEKAGVQFNMNFIPKQEDLRDLKDYAFNNINTHTDALGEELRGELSRGSFDKETPAQLKQRIKKVMSNPKFKQRIKTVMRTEKLRANNYGGLEAAKQSGLPLKKWVQIIRDNRTSDICKAEHRKYGSPSKAIPLDKPFRVSTARISIQAQASPFHPNCRSVIRFVRVEEKK